MPRYNQPPRGTANWDVPLNENFVDLGLEVTNEVATFADLPEPTGETSTNGIPRRYLVRESRTVVRDSGGSWETIVGLGREGTPVPGTGHFESIQTGEFYTVEGTTVSDIAEAVANHNYVKLQSGVTYTHDGSSTISHGREGGDTIVDASGASIQVRGTVVDIDDTSSQADSFTWYGGRFEGTNSAGELAFDVSDSVFNRFHPHEIRDCEGGMFFYNEELWCEFNTVSFKGKDNDVTVALIGNDGTAPPGSSFRDPTQSGGSPSFRNFDLNVYCNPQADVLSTCYGIYNDMASPYTSDWNVTVSGNRDCVGMRLSHRYQGSRCLYHYETPGGHEGGTGIVVEDYRRPWNQIITRIGGSVENNVINNSGHPLLHLDGAVQSGNGGGVFGPTVNLDGDTIERWTESVSSGRTREFEKGYYERFKETGSADDPVIKLGTNGAGFFVNDSGEIVAVDESGNTSSLT